MNDKKLINLCFDAVTENIYIQMIFADVQSLLTSRPPVGKFFVDLVISTISHVSPEFPRAQLWWLYMKTLLY